jgi:ribosome-associated translation inhibitor RaiA
MQVIVRSRGLDLGDRLRAIATRKVDGLERIAPDAERIEVDFAGQRNPRISDHATCAARLHLRHETLSAHAVAPVPEAALEQVVAKLRHQVARRKDQRIRSTHRAR